MVDLVVVVVSYNSAGLLGACLGSLQRHPLGAGRMETWLVDNASSDDSVALVRRDFPEVRVIANEHNLGFAGANNQVIERTDSRHVLLLNPDTELHEATLDRMMLFMDGASDAGAVGAQLINPDGSIQSSCRAFPTLRAVILRGTGLARLVPNDRSLQEYLMSDWDHTETREVDWLLGACLWMRRATIAEIGPLDDGFFMYYEDIDWCYRARQAGWRVYYLPTARLTHHHQRASARGINRLTWHHARSIVRLFRKHDLRWC